MKYRNKLKIAQLFLIRALFKIFEKVIPVIGNKLAIGLFFSPIRFAYPLREKEILSSAVNYKFDFNSYRIQVYEWGKGPVILFMHGWAGRATQCVEFINPLVEAGFKVVAFDAPSHGKTNGKKTNILEFADAINLITQNIGGVFGAIGHSLGGTALLLARSQGLNLDKLVLISVPSVAEGIISQFLNKIGGSSKTGEAIKKYVHKKFNRHFEEFSASYIVKSGFPHTPILLIHDMNDSEAPFYHFEELTKKLEVERTLVTENQGHTRILRNSEVIKETLSYFKSDVSINIPLKRTLM